MIYNLAAKGMIGLLALMGACGPDVTVVKNCAGVVVDQILNGGGYTPPAEPSKPPAYTEYFTCIVEVGEVVDPVSWTTGFKVLDPKGKSNGWGWYVACIINLPSGHHLPTIKQSRASNSVMQLPMLECLVSAPPVLGYGTCRFTTGQAVDRATYDRAYVAVGR